MAASHIGEFTTLWRENLEKNHCIWYFWDTLWIIRIIWFAIFLGQYHKEVNISISQVTVHAPRPTTTLYILIGNAKRTDMLNIMHTCIKAIRLRHLAVLCISNLICVHISHTLDLVIFIFSYKYGLYAKKNTVITVDFIRKEEVYPLTNENIWIQEAT